MSQCQNAPWSIQRKQMGSDLDYLRAVNSKGKAILTVCLSVCMCECVRLRACVAACLPFCHPGGGATLFFINLSECPHSLELVSVFVSLSVVPCPGLPQTSFSLCLKYDLF